jgi:hypothetical protein
MSSLARWSFTSTATHWPLTGRDAWSGVATFGAPVTFLCDYKAESKQVTDSKGVEFTSSQVIYTEHSGIKPGDRVLIGNHAGFGAVDAGAWEVRAIKRYADTFEGMTEDLEVVT